MSTWGKWSGKRVFWTLVTLIGLLLLVNLSQGVWDLWQVQERVTTAEEQLAELRAEEQLLEQQLSESQRLSFVEQQIRDTLHMAQLEDVVLLLPKDELASISPQPVAVPEEPKAMKPWQQWWALLWE